MDTTKQGSYPESLILHLWYVIQRNWQEMNSRVPRQYATAYPCMCDDIWIHSALVEARNPGLLNGKVGVGTCGPDRVPCRPLRFTNGPFLFENWFRYGSRYCKMLKF